MNMDFSGRIWIFLDEKSLWMVFISEDGFSGWIWISGEWLWIFLGVYGFFWMSVDFFRLIKNGSMIDFLSWVNLWSSGGSCISQWKGISGWIFIKGFLDGFLSWIFWLRFLDGLLHCVIYVCVPILCKRHFFTFIFSWGLVWPSACIETFQWS